MPNLTDFRTRFAEFADKPDATIELYLNDAENDISSTIWGKLYDRGVYYLTAHYLTTYDTTASGAINSIASQSVGSVSVSYSIETRADNLASSKYGQMYLQLKDRVSVGAGPCLV